MAAASRRFRLSNPRCTSYSTTPRDERRWAMQAVNGVQRTHSRQTFLDAFESIVSPGGHRAMSAIVHLDRDRPRETAGAC
jgi:hypothetical protein